MDKRVLATLQINVKATFYHSIFSCLLDRYFPVLRRLPRDLLFSVEKKEGKNSVPHQCNAASLPRPVVRRPPRKIICKCHDNIGHLLNSKSLLVSIGRHQNSSKECTLWPDTTSTYNLPKTKAPPNVLVRGSQNITCIF